MTARSLVWRQLHWQRPLDASACIALLQRLSTEPSARGVVLEARSHDHAVSFYLGTDPTVLKIIERLAASLLPDCRLAPVAGARSRVGVASQVMGSARDRRFDVATPETTVRSVLGALARAGSGETIAMQVRLGHGVAPSLVPPPRRSSTQPVWSVLWSGSLPATNEEIKAARDKHSEHGFDCLIRLGAAAASPARRRSLVGGVFAALRTIEPGGLRLRSKPTSTSAMTTGTRPFWSWSTRLTVSELLVFTAWPVGDTESLSGQPPLHPKRLPPTICRNPQRQIGRSTAPGVTEPLAQSLSDVLRHRHVVGPSGVGKSVLLSRLIAEDIHAGQPVIVVEPKGDLVDDVLRHIPSSRHQDVVILDPTDSFPVGLNPLALAPGTSPEVAAEGVLAIFKDLYAESWGPRTQDILHACLLTLARWSLTPDGRDTGVSLALLPVLLTNAAFRRRVTARVKDPIALDSFWGWFESVSDAERAAAIAPVMNKLRAWLYHPGLRAVLGQSQPKFVIRDIFTGASAATPAPIFLIPLRKGLIGQEAARLLGALVVSQVWQAVQARTMVPETRRRPVSVYVDECQEYVRLTTDVGDALATARGLGCSFTLAHQFLKQLPTDLRDGVLANARSRVCFQLSASDATTMASGHSELLPEDFTSLAPYEFQASLVVDHRVTPYAAGTASQEAAVTSAPSELRALSRERFGGDPGLLDAAIAELTTTSASTPATGRRVRRGVDAPDHSGGAS